jgi:hypothetical protein
MVELRGKIMSSIKTITLKFITVFSVLGFSILECITNAHAGVLTGNLLNDPGFETTTSLGNYNGPTVGVWVDENADIVSAVAGITPFKGSRMIRLNETFLVASQISQYLDVSAWATEIDLGNVTIHLSAFFNTPSNSTGAGLSVGWANPPGSDGIIRDRTFLQGRGLFLDDDPLTWELITTQAVLPVGTRFVFADFSGTNGTIPQGAFVDETSLHLESPSVPEPSTILGSLVVIGIGGAMKRRSN